MQESLTCISISQTTTTTTIPTTTSTTIPTTTSATTTTATKTKTTTRATTTVPVKKVVQQQIVDIKNTGGVSQIDESKITSFSRGFQVSQQTALNPTSLISKQSPTSRILRRKNQIKLIQNI